jgi:hypothetical protein
MLQEDAVIGNGTEYSRQCTTRLNNTLKIANITTDGDSKSFNGVNNAQGKGAIQLRDIRHQCPLWLGHFTAIPLFRSLDATLQSLLPRNTETIFLFLVLFSHIV